MRLGETDAYLMALSKPHLRKLADGTWQCGWWCGGNTYGAYAKSPQQAFKVLIGAVEDADARRFLLSKVGI